MLVIALVLGTAASVPPAFAASELLSRQLDAAPEPLPALARDGPWLHVCEALEEGERCRYEQMAMLESGGQVTFAILEPPPGEAPIAVFRAPLGVLLPTGLQLTFDGGSPGRIHFTSCNRFGCTASAPLDGSFRGLVARSNRVTLQFASPSDERFTVEFSLSRSAAILNSM
jgi:invasion protein IalB